MKIKLIQIGKTEDSYLIDGIKKYSDRLIHYVNFSVITIPALKNAKNLQPIDFKLQEAVLLLKNIQTTDFVILLDEKGKEFSSNDFAEYLRKQGVAGNSNLVFIIGGPFGFDEKIYQRADLKISLSKLTYSHQMIRLLFTEQLYRAMTIIRGESYHHE